MSAYYSQRSQSPGLGQQSSQSYPGYWSGAGGGPAGPAPTSSSSNSSRGAGSSQDAVGHPLSIPPRYGGYSSERGGGGYTPERYTPVERPIYDDRRPHYVEDHRASMGYYDRNEPYQPHPAYHGSEPPLSRGSSYSGYGGPPPPPSSSLPHVIAPMSDPYVRPPSARDDSYGYRPPDIWSPPPSMQSSHQSGPNPPPPGPSQSRSYYSQQYSRRERPSSSYNGIPSSYSSASYNPVSPRLPSSSVSRAPGSRMPSGDSYWSRSNRQRSISPDRRSHYPPPPDPYHPSYSRGPETARRNGRPSTVPSGASSSASQSGSRQSQISRNEPPRAYAPLSYPIPGQATKIRSEDFKNDTPLPIYPLRPPQEVSRPLGATFADSEALKQNIPREYNEKEKQLRDPAIDIVERKSRRGRSTPQGQQYQPPLDPAPGPIRSSDRLRDDSLSIERILKRMREGDFDSGEEHQRNGSKKVHLDGANSSQQVIGNGNSSTEGSAQSLLRIVEDTMAQIRGGQN
ncbi:hypothetical protein V1511DRAFT_329693 [Dipodascopsis uninucleata]